MTINTKPKHFILSQLPCYAIWMYAEPFLNFYNVFLQIFGEFEIFKKSLFTPGDIYFLNSRSW